MVIDPGSVEESARLVRGVGDVANFAAFTIYTPQQSNGYTTSAPRVFAQDVNLAKNSQNAQRDTFVHELTHYAAAPLAGPFTPKWVQEGLAEWLRLQRPSYVAATNKDPTLPTAADFGSTDGAQISRAYRSSASVMAFVDSRKGNTGPTDFFQNLGARRLNIGSPAHNVDQSIRESFNLSTAEFSTAWAASQ